MDKNQNLPNEFFEKLADGMRDSTSVFFGGIANAPVPTDTEPITLERLVKMKEAFEAKFPEPLKYKDGADMSPETFNLMVDRLGIKMASKDSGRTWFDPTISPMFGTEIHLVPGMELGDVQECRCPRKFGKIKFQAHAYKPLPGRYMDETGPHRGVPPSEEELEFIRLQNMHRRIFIGPYDAEITQEMSVEEAMRRYPDRKHILKDKDGVRALCGGPGLCKLCDEKEETA